MFLALINECGSKLSTPILVFRAFLEKYSGFDWSRYICTVQGPILIDTVPHGNLRKASPKKLQLPPLLNEGTVQHYRDQYEKSRKANGQQQQQRGAAGKSTAALPVDALQFPLQAMNVCHPIDLSCNVMGDGTAETCRSLIVQAFKRSESALR